MGICRDEGRLALTDRALSIFPEFKATAAPGSEDITLRDLLHMASGKTARDYLMPRLFAPLGIRNPMRETCPKGHTIAS